MTKETVSTVELVLDEEREYPFLHGGIDKTLRMVEDSRGVAISIRGNRILIQGGEENLARAERLIQEIREVNREGYILKPEDIGYATKRRGSQPVRELWEPH